MTELSQLQSQAIQDHKAGQLTCIKITNYMQQVDTNAYLRGYNDALMELATASAGDGNMSQYEELDFNEANP